MIWRRYITKEAFAFFANFLLGSYCVYALIEYSMHMQNFHSEISPSLKEILLYYAFLFVKKLDILVPLALLVTTTKVLSTLSQRRELLALQAGGITLSKIVRPFFLLAALSSLLLGACHEWLIPSSVTKLSLFEATYFKNQRRDKRKERVLTTVSLSDGSYLSYQSYDKERELLFDVFLIDRPDIYRMKWLDLSGDMPEGKYVDVLGYTDQDLLEKSDSFTSLPFPSVSFTEGDTSVAYENKRLSDLLSLFSNVQAQTHLFFVLSMIFTPFLVVLGTIAPCVSFSRNTPILLSFGLSIFSFITYFVLMNASLVLGENFVLHPFVALCSLPIVLLFSFGTMYWRVAR